MPKESKKTKPDRNWFKKVFNSKSIRQQRLPAWTPILSASTVVPMLVITAISLILIGSGFIYMATNNTIIELEYTDCIPLHGTKTCSQILSDWRDRTNASWPPPECVCWYKFKLDRDLSEKVFVYYGLYNYFQNHLRYGRSIDMSQFHGRPTASPDCAPYQNKPVRVDGKWQYRPVVPCGTVANSMFNDTFAFWRVQKGESLNNSIVQVPLSRVNIAWAVDHKNYRNCKLI